MGYARVQSLNGSILGICMIWKYLVLADQVLVEFSCESSDRAA